MRGFLDRARAYVARPFAPGWRTTVGELVLVVVFAMLSSLDVLKSFVNWALGWDALIYTHAADAMLHGGNAWGPVHASALFAGPPTHLLPFVPFIWLPDQLVIAAWTALSAASAIYILRKLDLPLWWLTFPPIVVAILAGSEALPVMALVVRGGALAQGAATAFRAYVALPMALLGKWRALVIAALIVVVSAPLLDWPGFFRSLTIAAGVLDDQASGGKSAIALPWTIPVAMACLFLLGRNRAAWLIVPALWPYSQNYYNVLALPVVAAAPLVALTLAVDNVKALVVVGLVAQVAFEWLTGRLDLRAVVDSWTSWPGLERLWASALARTRGLRAGPEPPPSVDPG